jgi:2-polyprenyl-6-hydroxyphenyl methylase/3-demethylubiquinone-9 3-methyltransferase
LTEDYYSIKLSANKLKQCYEIAPARVEQYLQAEIDHVKKHIKKSDSVLELGCGYGRILHHLLGSSKSVVGIDTSLESLELVIGSPILESVHLAQMNAVSLGFRDSSFDKTICIQNGISAFKIDPAVLIAESVRVTKNGGTCLFSSYSDQFWKHRLEWFVLQSERGLLGEIDWDKTGDGVIVCRDGFKATTFREGDFHNLTKSLGLKSYIVEVDQSSLFCEIKVEK